MEEKKVFASKHDLKLADMWTSSPTPVPKPSQPSDQASHSLHTVFTQSSDIRQSSHSLQTGFTQASHSLHTVDKQASHRLQATHSQDKDINKTRHRIHATDRYNTGVRKTQDTND